MIRVVVIVVPVILIVIVAIFPKLLLALLLDLERLRVRRLAAALRLDVVEDDEALGGAEPSKNKCPLREVCNAT